MQRRHLLLLCASAGLALAGCAAERVSSTTGSVVVAGISVRAAREHARLHGLVSRRALPAQYRRLLQEGQPLPAEVPLFELPTDFVARLPAVEGHEWKAAGTDLLLVDRSTQVIASILRGPLR
jgi:hypothetical protein